MKINSLEDRITVTVNYVNKLKYRNKTVQCKYLFDALYRYEQNLESNIKTKSLIELLKQFGSLNKYQERYDHLVKKYDMSFIDENCKLMLMKVLVLEDI